MGGDAVRVHRRLHRGGTVGLEPMAAMMGPFGTNPVHIDSQGNHVEPPSGIEERIAEVLWETDFYTKRPDHYYALLAAAVAQALQPSAAEQKLAAIQKLADRWRQNPHPVLRNVAATAVLDILDSDDTPREKATRGKGIEELIEASSLGTSAAKALRESVSDEEAQRIVDRVNEMNQVRDIARRLRADSDDTPKEKP